LEIEKLKLKVKDSVELQRQQLVQLSLNIHANHELGFKEEKASAWLTGYLEDSGFHVEQGIAGLATAFRATYGQGSPRIALLAEYDALPKMGHGYGHNIMAASASASEAGHEGLLDAAKVMAMTVVDILQPGMLDKIKQEFYSG
jgi:metal-dependent amidase/aminoacylase/carboxypeptidase family protein